MSWRNIRARLDKLERARRRPIGGIDWDAIARGDFSTLPAPDPLPGDKDDPAEELIAAMQRGDLPAVAEFENNLGLSASEETPGDKVIRSLNQVVPVPDDDEFRI